MEDAEMPKVAANPGIYGTPGGERGSFSVFFFFLSRICFKVNKTDNTVLEECK